MVLSHPSGTLEKKVKRLKKKGEKKRKEKKENAPGGQMKRKNALGFLKEANDRRLRFFSFHLALRPNEKKNALGF